MNCSCKRMSREQLLDWINMISFAVIETSLYLDTHPCDVEALKFFDECIQMRKIAISEYSEQYEPLTLDLAGGNQNNWRWVMSPWPWEGKC